MITLTPEALTIAMIGAIVVGIMSGFPLAMPMGAVTIFFGYAIFGSAVFSLIYVRMFDIFLNYVLIAAPLFIFMGLMMERSGIADSVYEALQVALRNVRGGLAIVTVLAGTVFAACVGIVGASVTMLTLLSLLPMVKRDYNKSLASGAICAGGTLGILIPPSLMLVIYGPMAQISVGKLFFGAIVPGVLLASLYICYIAIRVLFQPRLAPSAPPEEVAIPLTKKMLMLITSLSPVMVVMMAVLGTIFFGICPPTEAAAVGCIAITLLAIARRSLTWQTLKETALGTLRINAMILLIAAVCFAFVGVFLGGGCGEVIANLIVSTPFGRWGAFAMIMFVLFVLGCLLDWLGIVFIIIPIVSPVIPVLGFDPLWFALMVCINLQMSFMTPPVAVAIYYLRGCAPPEAEVSMSDVIKGVVPFCICIVVALVLCALFPQLILWLPGMMIK